MNGSSPVSHFSRRVGEIADRRDRGTRPAACPCRAHISRPNVPRYRASDQYSKASGSPDTPSKPPARPISPSRPSCSAKPSVDRLLRRRLAGLVIDDREAAVGKPVDPVGPAVDGDPGERRFAADLRLERPPPLGLVARAPAPRSSRSPPAGAAPTARAASGGSPRPAASCSARGAQPVGIAIVVQQPFLEHLVNRVRPSTARVWSASTGSRAASFRIALA